MIDINNKIDCCGCSACMQKCPKSCIVMKKDSEGFLYPKIDTDHCISCGLCEKVCPMKHPYVSANIKDVFAFKHANDYVRFSSSSGGAFYYYANKVLKVHGVVYGAAFDKGWVVRHKRVNNIDDLEYLRKSKYVQSDINDTYVLAQKDLKAGKYVLYSGTPCQIAGLKTFLGREYENLLTIDVFCHGVPSPEVFNSYLKEIMCRPNATINSNIIRCLNLSLESHRNNLLEVNFRDKEHSRWRLCSLKLRFKENTESEKIIVNNWKKDIFNQGFLSHLYLRPSCHKCRFRNQTSGSDISIGDFWGIETVVKNLNDDDLGYNAVIINTEKGYNVSKDMDRIASTSFEDVVRNNGSLQESPIPHIMREVFFKYYRTWGVLFMAKVCMQKNIIAKIFRKLFIYYKA